MTLHLFHSIVYIFLCVINTTGSRSTARGSPINILTQVSHPHHPGRMKWNGMAGEMISRGSDYEYNQKLVAWMSQ